MDNDINKPITKETTIIQGCATGHHLFGNNSMLGIHNGILEMRMKCTICAAELAEPIPGLASSMPEGPLSIVDGKPLENTIEKVPVPEKQPEPEIKFEEPMEEIRQRPFADPIWANDVRERYQHDKGLDNFWGDVWDRAKSGK